jgi:hypothetical protein
VPAAFAGCEERRFIIGITTVSDQIGPQRSWKNYSVSLAAFAKQRDLAGIAVDLNVPPLRSADFGNSAARSVEHPQEHPVPAFRRQGDHLVNLGFRQYSFGQRVHRLGRTHGGGDGEPDVSKFQSEAEKALDGGVA